MCFLNFIAYKTKHIGMLAGALHIVDKCRSLVSNDNILHCMLYWHKHFISTFINVALGTSWHMIDCDWLVIIRYADDKAVVANSQKGLQQLMDNLNNVSRDLGMKINVKKTKVMCMSQKGNSKIEIYVDGQQVDRVSQLRYFMELSIREWRQILNS